MKEDNKGQKAMPDAVGRPVVKQTETWQKGPTPLLRSEAEAQTGSVRRRRERFVHLFRGSGSSMESHARCITPFPNFLAPEVKVKEEMQNGPAS